MILEHIPSFLASCRLDGLRHFVPWQDVQGVAWAERLLSKDQAEKAFVCFFYVVNTLAPTYDLLNHTGIPPLPPPPNALCQSERWPNHQTRNRLNNGLTWHREAPSKSCTALISIWPVPRPDGPSYKEADHNLGTSQCEAPPLPLSSEAQRIQLHMENQNLIPSGRSPMRPLASLRPNFPGRWWCPSEKASHQAWKGAFSRGEKKQGYLRDVAPKPRGPVGLSSLLRLLMVGCCCADGNMSAPRTHPLLPSSSVCELAEVLTFSNSE